MFRRKDGSFRNVKMLCRFHFVFLCSRTREKKKRKRKKERNDVFFYSCLTRINSDQRCPIYIYIYIYIVSAANRYCNATVSSRADKTATISIREVSRWIIRRERGAMERHTCSVSWTSRLVGDMHEIEPALLFE